MVGKKWIHLERNTHHRHSVGHLRRQEREPQNMVWLVFWAGWFHSLMSGKIIPTTLG